MEMATIVCYHPAAVWEESPAMYRRHLTAEFVRSILDYNPETGIFRWKHRADRAKNWNTRWAGKVAGHQFEGYIVIQLDRPNGAFQAARIAWLYVHGEWPPDQVDHINLVRDDNRIANLRAANNLQNNSNRGPQRNNKSSGLRGVHFHTQTGKWRAKINVDSKTHSLGLHHTPEEAAAARDAAAKRLLGEYATLSNSPATTYERH